MLKRGAILLECVLAIAILVAAAVSIMGFSDQAINAAQRAHHERVATDLARSAMAMLEAGVVSAEDLTGDLEQLDDGTPDPLPAPSGSWRLEVRTQPAGIGELTRVTVIVTRLVPGTDTEQSSFQFHQIVRISARRESPAAGTGGT